MKKIIPILILGAATSMFTACHKQQSTNASPQPLATEGANQGYSYTTKIIYQLTALKTGTDSILYWDGGYMHIAGVTFNPIYTGKNADTRMLPTQSTNRIGQPIDYTFNFFGPSIITGVAMPVINSQMANVTIQATPKGTTQTLELTGQYNYAVDMPPYPPHRIKFTVSQPLDLNTVWVQKAAITNAGAQANIVMDLQQLSRGITYPMMNAATVTGNTIYISATQNVNIYNILVENLRSMQLGLTLTPGAEAKAGM